MISQKLTSLLLILALLCSTHASATPKKPVFQCSLKWFLIGSFIVVAGTGGVIQTWKWRSATLPSRLHSLPNGLVRYAEMEDLEKYFALKSLTPGMMSPDVQHLFDWIGHYERNPKLREVAQILRADNGNGSPQTDYKIFEAYIGTPFPKLEKLQTEAELNNALQELISKRKGRLAPEDERALEELKKVLPWELQIHMVSDLRSVLVRKAGQGLSLDEWFKQSLADIRPEEARTVDELQDTYSSKHPYAAEMISAFRRLGPRGIERALTQGGARTFKGRDGISPDGDIVIDAYKNHFSEAETTFRDFLRSTTSPKIRLFRRLKAFGPAAKSLAQDVRNVTDHESLETRIAAFYATVAMGEHSPTETQKFIDILSALMTRSDPGNYVGTWDALLEPISTWPEADQKKTLPILREAALRKDLGSVTLRFAEELIKLAPKSPETIDVLVTHSWVSKHAEHLTKLALEDANIKQELAKRLSQKTNSTFASRFLNEHCKGTQEHIEYLNHPERWVGLEVVENARIINELKLNPKLAHDFIKNRNSKVYEEVRAIVILAPNDPDTLKRVETYAMDAISRVNHYSSPSPPIENVKGLIEDLPPNRSLASRLRGEVGKALFGDPDNKDLQGLAKALANWEKKAP